MRRLFTFGCSFTSYEWPTWADILGREFDYFENWGRRGSGNQFICNSIAEADARNNFTKDDTIVIMWSSMMREDRYIEGGWVTPGNFGGEGASIYGKDFHKNFLDYRGCYVRDLASMHLVDNLLKYKECQHYYLSMVDIEIPIDMYADYFIQKLKLHNQTERLKDPLSIYSNVVSKIKPSVHKVIFNYDWQSRKVLMAPSSKTGIPHRADSHPIPIEHLEYLQKVLPEVIISDNTVNWTKQVSEEVCNFTFYKNKTWNPEMYKPKERL